MINTMFDFNHSLLRALSDIIDANALFQLQSQLARENILSDREHDLFVKEVADEVLSRINVSVDVSEAFKAIDGLDERINRLGK